MVKILAVLLASCVTLGSLFNIFYPQYSYFFMFFVDLYLFIFRERGRKGEREGEKHLMYKRMCERYIHWLHLACPQLGTWPATQAGALTGNGTGDLSVHRPVHRPVLDPLSHTCQG